MFKKSFIVIFIVFIMTLFGACEKPTVENELNFFTTMGETPVFLTFESQEVLNKHYRPIKNIFDTYSALTDNFEPLANNSGYLENIYSINQKIAAATSETTIEIDYELYQILNYAKEIEGLTDGYFNITIGKIIDVWKSVIATYQDSIIPQNVIDQTLDLVNEIPVKRDAFRLTSTNNKYYLIAQNEIKLDLGALAKGYALNLTRLYLTENNVAQYLINAGESSIALGINPKRENDVYYIGLSNPIYNRDTNKDINDPVNQLYYAYYYLKNLCITTSGNNRQHALGADGNRYHHIISPVTKKPENYYHSLTLINLDAGYADALTTALFSMPSDLLAQFVSDNVADELIVFNTNNAITKYNTTHQFKAVSAFSVTEVS